MGAMFCFSTFNGDISEWNVSSVTSMRSLFERTSFNGDISGWDVSSVTSMDGMFDKAVSFDVDIISQDGMFIAWLQLME